MISAQTEWGVPKDWASREAYGDIDEWDEDRWQWEFLRRDEDYRILFEQAATLAPSEPDTRLGFTDLECQQLKSAGLIHWPFKSKTSWSWGLPYFFDPRVSDWFGKGPAWGSGMSVVESGTLLDHGNHIVAVRFNLWKPLKPQIADALSQLKDDQRSFLTKGDGAPVVQSDNNFGNVEAWFRKQSKSPKQHRENWPHYLQFLDGAAAGASLRELSCALPEKYANRSEQTAKNVLEQAKTVRFSF